MSWYDVDFNSYIELTLVNYVDSYVYADADIYDNTAKAVADASASGDNTFTATGTSTSTSDWHSSSNSVSESATD
ncbi:hypothetical protein JYK14_16850 [Siccirubricoccus sp. KC 17139]|uniref:Uncharacterized protein n=1 Tax=Siccirubricoccus soli TaxID=2899147 RepID=A0ABT1D7A5_9PROT|nr:hypothetical protein [Siccirubricoccus soli]MCO6417819.1 hypothetical protein [Siccirubricoccus soli]MCP2683954.1 hypothetical protein [Siccirubricoccus soli]